MSVALNYLLTFFPPLPELGGVPSVTIAEVCARLIGEDDRVLRRLAGVFTTWSELETAAAAWVTGEKLSLSPTCQETVTAEIPECGQLLESDPQSANEAVWLTRFHDVLSVWLEKSASRVGSRLLADWLRFERQLRAELALRRRQWWEEQQPGFTAEFPEISVSPTDNDQIAAEAAKTATRWQNVTDPMAAELLLDQTHWNFICARYGHYSFSIEEMVGYLLKLRLVQRHQVFSRERGISMLQEVTAP